MAVVNPQQGAVAPGQQSNIIRADFSSDGLRGPLADIPPCDGKFKVVRGDAIRRLKLPTALVHGRFTSESLAFIVGPSGSGKTFLAVSLATAIATEQPSWLGAAIPAAVRGRPVIYASAEGCGYAKIRILAAVRHHLNDDQARIPDSFSLVPESLHLDSDESVRDFIDQFRDLRPALVVIDTYSRHGGAESEVELVSAVIERIARIQAALKTTVLVLHHTPKTGAATPRGSGALDAAADTVAHVEGALAADKWTTVRFEQRDLEASSFSIRAKPATLLDISVDGHAASTWVIEAADETQPRHKRTVGDGDADSLIRAILAKVTQKPGISQRDLIDAVRGRTDTILQALLQLADDGRLRRDEAVGRGGKPLYAYFPVDVVPLSP